MCYTLRGAHHYPGLDEEDDAQAEKSPISTMPIQNKKYKQFLFNTNFSLNILVKDKNKHIFPMFSRDKKPDTLQNTTK